MITKFMHMLFSKTFHRRIDHSLARSSLMLAVVAAAALADEVIAQVRSRGFRTAWAHSCPGVCDGMSAVGESRHRIPRRIPD
jgi:hypothetical protein